MKTTAKDLRFHSKRLLEAVSRGEEVIITYRGKAVAKMVPIDSKSGKKFNKTTHGLFGIWNDNDKTSDVDHYVRNLRKSRC